eukprot:9391011-Ditylum_brightwellii.AAC.1
MAPSQLVDNITKNFLHLLLPKLVEKPNYKKLYKLHKMLMANAASVSTSLGGGTNGHHALVVSDTTYRQTAGQDFPPPVNPGLTPVQPTQFMTNAEIDLLHENY